MPTEKTAEELEIERAQSYAKEQETLASVDPNATAGPVESDADLEDTLEIEPQAAAEDSETAPEEDAKEQARIARAHEQFKARQANRNELRAENEKLKAQNDQWRGYYEKVVKNLNASQAPAAPDPQKDGPGYLRHVVNEAVAPVRETVTQLKQRQEQADSERRQAESIQRATADLTSQREAYEQTPDGAGMKDRVQAWYAREFTGLAKGGLPKDAIEDLVMGQLSGWQQEAASLGVPFPDYVDLRIKAQGVTAPPANGNGATPAAPSAAAARIAHDAKVAKASGQKVKSPPDAPRARGESIEKMISLGQIPSPEEMAKMVGSGDPKTAVDDMIRMLRANAEV